jgi:hypothetical protein
VSIPTEVMENFNNGVRTDSVRFVMNDVVQVSDRKNKNRTGTIISLFSLEPVTTYLVEPAQEPWGDFQAGQADLELAK